MIVIKIILWVLLALLLLVILALAIPVRAAVRYNDDITLVVKYLFLKFPIDLSGDNKEKKEKNKEKAKKNKKDKKIRKKTSADVTEKNFSSESEEKNEPSENHEKNNKKKKVKEPKKENAAVKWFKDTFKERGLKGLINVLKELARLAGTFLKPIFKHIKIKHLDLNITVASEDAADTAVKYGYVCAGVYPALAVLLKVMRYDDYSVNIAPDFDKKAPEFDVFAEISLIPWFAVFGAVHALVNFIILKAKGKL